MKKIKNNFLILSLFFTFVAIKIFALDNSEESMFSFIDTNTSKEIENSSLYIKALYLEHVGEDDLALKTYDYLYKNDAPPEYYDGYLRILSKKHKYSKILKIIDEIPKIVEGKIDLLLIHAQSLINTSDDKKAEKILNDLKDKHPNDPRVINALAVFHTKDNNLEKALESIDSSIAKAEEKQKASLLFLKSKLLFKTGKVNQALVEISHSLKIEPKTPGVILFKAHIMEKLGKVNSAIESYENFLDIAGNRIEESLNSDITKKIVSMLFSTNQFDKASKRIRTLKNKPIEYFFDLALIEFKAKRPKIGLENIKKVLKLNPAFPKSKILNLDILLSLKENDLILKTSKELLAKDPNDNDFIYKLIGLATNDKNFSKKSILEILEHAKEKNKNNNNLALAIADLAVELGLNNKALSNYQKVLDSTENLGLKKRILFQKAFVNLKDKKINKALEELNKAEKIKTVYIPNLHLKAYCLMEMNKLEEAHKYIEKTMEHKTEISAKYRASVLDTKALIYKKEKKHDLELQTLREAHNLAPNNKTIKEHYDDAKERSKK